MYYITVFPDELYFHWQTQVQHYNFIVKQGIKPENIICIVGYKGTPNIKFYTYLQKVGVKFYYYDIYGLNLTYSPIIRPFLLKNFYKDNVEFENEFVFIHDTDIIFTQLPLFDGISNYNWYLSDCNNYLGYDYLKRFGDTLFTDMCNIVGINKNNVINRSKDFNAGGAQYYGKGLNWKFWDKVEKDTLNLYNLLNIQTETNKKEFLEINKHELTDKNRIQVWTAGMWADLWNLFLIKNVLVESELDFSWGNQSNLEFLSKKIHHNAGVTNDLKDIHFCKNDFRTETPFNKDFNYSNSLASYYYTNEIKETKYWLNNGNLL